MQIPSQRPYPARKLTRVCAQISVAAASRRIPTVVNDHVATGVPHPRTHERVRRACLTSAWVTPHPNEPQESQPIGGVAAIRTLRTAPLTGWAATASADTKPAIAIACAAR